MFAILGGDSFKKMKPIGIVGIMFAAAAIGFFGMTVGMALHRGVFVPALWCLLMLVVYLPLVSIVCKKQSTRKMWRRRVALSFVAFTLYALIVGAALVFVFN